MSDNINDAFLAMQQDLPIIDKDGAVSIPTKKGAMKFKYATLETIHKAVKPVLFKHGFSLSYPIKDGCIQVLLNHKDNNEHAIGASIKFEPLSDPKQTGSLITYYKRYLITALLALDTDEDLDVAPFQERPKKAKMTEETFKQAEDRIVGGDQNIVKQCLAYFDLTQEQHDRLLNLELVHKKDG